MRRRAHGVAHVEDRPSRGRPRDAPADGERLTAPRNRNSVEAEPANVSASPPSAGGYGGTRERRERDAAAGESHARADEAPLSVERDADLLELPRGKGGKVLDGHHALRYREQFGARNPKGKAGWRQMKPQALVKF